MSGDLAERQAALVAALVAGGPAPAGFDPAALAAAGAALLRKRAGEVARHWPLLAAGLGPQWSATFAIFEPVVSVGGRTSSPPLVLMRSQSACRSSVKNITEG